MRITRRFATACTVMLATSFGISSLFAQDRPRSKANPPAPRSAQPQEVALSGTVVDLQSYMTGEPRAKNPEAFSRNCIRRGVPAALETESGLIILGFAKGNASMLAQHAMKSAEVRGTLHIKQGVKYLEVASIKKLKSLENEPVQEEGLEEMEEDEPEDEPEEDPEPEPEPAPDPPDDPNAD